MGLPPQNIPVGYLHSLLISGTEKPIHLRDKPIPVRKHKSRQHAHAQTAQRTQEPRHFYMLLPHIALVGSVPMKAVVFRTSLTHFRPTYHIKRVVSGEIGIYPYLAQFLHFNRNYALQPPTLHPRKRGRKGRGLPAAGGDLSLWLLPVVRLQKRPCRNGWSADARYLRAVQLDRRRQNEGKRLPLQLYVRRPTSLTHTPHLSTRWQPNRHLTRVCRLSAYYTPIARQGFDRNRTYPVFYRGLYRRSLASLGMTVS